MAEQFRVQGAVGLDGSGFFRTVKQMETATGRLAGNMRNALGNRLAGLFSVGALGLAFRRTIDYAGKLTDIAAATNVGVEALQRYNKALKESGATLEDMVTFWNMLDRARAEALADPKGRYAEAFKFLGFSGQDLRSSSAQQMGDRIWTSYNTSKTPASMDAALAAVGGRAVAKLRTVFRDGLIDMQNDLQVMTTNEAIILDSLGDKFSTLGDVIAVKLAPVLGWAIERVYDFVDGVDLIGETISGVGQTIWNTVKGYFGNLSPSKLKEDPFAPFRAAKDGFTNAYTALTNDLAQTIDRQIAAGEARKLDVARKAKGLTAGGPKEFLPFEDRSTEGGKDKALPFDAYSDALVAVGNFLGSGRNSLQVLANRHLDEIERNTRQIVENTRPKAGAEVLFPE